MGFLLDGAIEGTSYSQRGLVHLFLGFIRPLTLLGGLFYTGLKEVGVEATFSPTAPPYLVERPEIWIFLSFY